MKHALFGISFLFLITLGCSEKESFPEENLEREYMVSSISVIRQEMSRSSDETETLPVIPGEAANLLGYNDFTEGSLLYISQMGTEKDPDFSRSSTSNLYIYEYHENSEAKWNEEYNFVPYIIDANEPQQKAPLVWGLVKGLGQVGNSYSLYAMSFPSSTAATFNESNLNFEVKTDQTGNNNPYATDNFYNSDILGAYHATPSNVRLRFRLHHLMVQLKITIYVPVFKDYLDDQKQYRFQGFNEDAMIGGYLLNAQNQFSISWRTNRSSDTEPPLTKGDGGKIPNIKMYMHEPENEVIGLKDIQQFFPSIDEDVRAYNFNVLFPEQTFNTNDNLLCFVLKGVPDDTYKYYYFSGNQVVSDPDNYKLTQGNILHLYLYIPPTTNQTILVGANILNWGNSYSDMTVTQEKNNSSSFEGSED